ncbi:MAG: Similar to F420-dependent glucose-6-phosphate dehydrogenase, SCO6495 family, partial [uncultured Rubrobacteraceae bacterium]
DTQGNGPERPPGGGSGLHHRLDLGPLPPLDRRAGPEPFRMERDRGYRQRHRRYTSGHWRHLSHHTHPPSDNRPGHGDFGGDAGGSILVRHRQRREPQRAHTRGPL